MGSGKIWIAIVLKTCENDPSIAAPPMGSFISATWVVILVLGVAFDMRASCMPGEMSVARIGMSGYRAASRWSREPVPAPRSITRELGAESGGERESTISMRRAEARREL